MRRFEIHLCQDKDFYDVFTKERLDEVIDCYFNTNKEAICYTLDKLKHLKNINMLFYLIIRVKI